MTLAFGNGDSKSTAPGRTERRLELPSLKNGNAQDGCTGTVQNS